MTERGDSIQVQHVVGILLISLAALLLEVCLTRLLAVTLWYHFSFMIISTALLGFGAAAVLVSLWKKLRQAPMDRTLPGASALLAITTVGCFALSQMLPLEPFSLANDSTQYLYLAGVYILLAFPFFLAGIVISILFARLTKWVTLLYSFDLVGAGLGAVLGLALLSSVGAPGTLVIAAACAAAGAAAFAWKQGVKLRVAGLALTALFLALAWSANDWVPLRISTNKILLGSLSAAEVLSNEQAVEHTIWSATGRVDVLRQRGGGRRIVIDGGVAATRVPRISGPVDQMAVPREGLAAAFVPLDAPQVLVIGSGGGYEVAGALAAGASSVVGVEMNPAIVRLVRRDLSQVLGGLFDDPRVQLHVDEGRSFVRRAGPEAFDLIICAHTISNAAMSSGAVSLTENYTLTTEAFEDFLASLRPGGVLWMTRPEAQLPRLVATARAALEASGTSEAARHIVAYRRPTTRRSFLGGVIVSSRPFTGEQVVAMDRALRRDRLSPILLPGHAARGQDADALEVARSGRGDESSDPFLGLTEPTTDDRPFFNQRKRWSEITIDDVQNVLGQGTNGRMAMEETPVAEVAVLVVLLWAAVLSLVFVVVPLVAFKRSGLATKKALRILPFFLCLGLGYITVEICLIQRLILFVGRPEYAMAVVLGTMLVASGAGSLAATKVAHHGRKAATVAALIVTVLVVVDAFAGPAVVQGLLGMSLAGRMTMAAILTAPLGFVMGAPMPLGLRSISQTADNIVPWAFGLNCAMSVIGSVLTVILSSSIGFGATLIVAAVIYCCAALSTALWRVDR